MEMVNEHRIMLREIELLVETERGGHNQEWYEGTLPPNDPNRQDRAIANRDLMQRGLIEKDDRYPTFGHPHAYRLTDSGLAFLNDVRKRIGNDIGIDWDRVNEIEFPAS